MWVRFQCAPLAKKGAHCATHTQSCSQPLFRRKGKSSACRGPQGVNLEDTAGLSPPGQGPVVQGRGRPARRGYRQCSMPSAKLCERRARAPYARVRIRILVEGLEKTISRRFNFDFLVLDVRGSGAVKPRRVRCSSDTGRTTPRNTCNRGRRNRAATISVQRQSRRKWAGRMISKCGY